MLEGYNIPNHIAVIMDGNGRWAKSKGMPRVYGHREGVKRVKEITEVCGEIGVKYLTLYAFSTENWRRPAYEVNALMGLLVSTIDKEIDSLVKNNVKLEVIGDIAELPKKSFESMQKGMRLTEKNTGLKLILALNYSGRWDIIRAVNKLKNEVGEITSDIFEKYLSTGSYPDPELLIRTSGEIRLSNFLLWELAYAELYFTKKMWPDFHKESLFEAIKEYNRRDRRFGEIKE